MAGSACFSLELKIVIVLVVREGYGFFFYFSLLKSGNEILEPECYFIGYLFTYTLVVKDTIILCAY